MNKTPTAPLILIDGSSYLFRAYHALPPLANTKGMPTGAIYGVLNMLQKLLKEYEPTHIAVIFDSKSKNFRHAMYPAYKANRAIMPDELQIQIKPLFAAIHALGLPLIVIEGVEADDIIGTLARQAQQQNMRVLISTGDKDFAQLVNPNVTLINTMNQQILDEAGVQEKFGVSPAQIIDYLALTGDSVDNIPGIPNVGPKTSAHWLGQYHTLDNLLQNASEIRGKVGENLRNNIQQVLLGRELVTIKTDIALPMTLQELTPKMPDQAQLKALFTELEFKTWLRDLPQAGKLAHKTEPQTISDEAALQVWIKKLEKSAVFALNIETTSLDAMRAEWVGISLAIPGGEAAYLPMAPNSAETPKQLDCAHVLKALTPVFNDPQKIIVGQNLKYDLKVLSHYNITVKSILWDTLLAAYVLASGGVQIAEKEAKPVTFNKIPVDVTLHLYEELTQKFKENPELETVFNTIDMPLMRILAQMEQYGVLIDAAKLQQQSALLQQHIQALEKEVYALSGEAFNLSSPKQLQEVLYGKLKLPVLKKTPTGQPSTSEEVLQELALKYPIPQLILTYRSFCKLKSTYTDRLPEEINPRTGRIHTCYQQAVTSTGRLSSIDPNLQNIPVRSEEGRKIRQAFIAPPHYKILAADYSQVELRIMAHLAQDPGLLHAFAQGLDVHRSTAAEVYGIPLEQVTSEQRRSAKAINFGLMYGMSSFGLSQQLNVSQKEAQKHMDIYFKKYPYVHAYMEQARALAAKQGYLKTLFNRRIQIPDIKSSNKFRRLAAERQAINAPLQGTAADIIKLAMICIHDWLSQNKKDTHMIMQVHDELVFEVPAAQADHLAQEVRRCMEHVVELSAPLVVNIGIGDNWDEAH